jgi:hypothetical protein
MIALSRASSNCKGLQIKDTRNNYDIINEYQNHRGMQNGGEMILGGGGESSKFTYIFALVWNINTFITYPTITDKDFEKKFYNIWHIINFHSTKITPKHHAGLIFESYDIGF